MRVCGRCWSGSKKAMEAGEKRRQKCHERGVSIPAGVCTCSLLFKEGAASNPDDLVRRSEEPGIKTASHPTRSKPAKGLGHDIMCGGPEGLKGCRIGTAERPQQRSEEDTSLRGRAGIGSRQAETVWGSAGLRRVRKVSAATQLNPMGRFQALRPGKRYLMRDRRPLQCASRLGCVGPQLKPPRTEIRRE